MPQVKIRISQESAEKMESEGRSASVSKEKIATVSIFAHTAVNTAKQIVNYSISSVGVRTGNYVLQEQINHSVEILGDLTSIGTGFAAGGWVGGLVAIAGVTTKNIIKEVGRNEEIRHENIESEYLRRRSGSPITNNSRGTEN